MRIVGGESSSGGGAAKDGLLVRFRGAGHAGNDKVDGREVCARAASVGVGRAVAAKGVRLGNGGILDLRAVSGALVDGRDGGSRNHIQSEDGVKIGQHVFLLGDGNNGLKELVVKRLGDAVRGRVEVALRDARHDEIVGPSAVEAHGLVGLAQSLEMGEVDATSLFTRGVSERARESRASQHGENEDSRDHFCGGS